MILLNEIRQNSTIKQESRRLQHWEVITCSSLEKTKKRSGVHRWYLIDVLSPKKQDSIDEEPTMVEKSKGNSRKAELVTRKGKIASERRTHAMMAGESKRASLDKDWLTEKKQILLCVELSWKFSKVRDGGWFRKILKIVLLGMKKYAFKPIRC